MLTRRQLIARGASLLILTPVLSPVLAGCSSDDGSSNKGGSCDGIDSTSSNNANHTHTACILTTDLAAPPTAGVTYTSSNDGAHTHTIMLTMAQLASIEGGTAVTVASSAASDGDSHTHTWTISKT